MSNHISAGPRRDRRRQTAAEEARDLLAECDAFEIEMASECIARRNERERPKPTTA